MQYDQAPHLTFAQQEAVQRVYDMHAKSSTTAFLLCYFLGIFGAHRMYVGQWGAAALRLLLPLIAVGLAMLGVLDILPFATFSLAMITLLCALVWVALDLARIDREVNVANAALLDHLLATVVPVDPSLSGLSLLPAPERPEIASESEAPPTQSDVAHAWREGLMESQDALRPQVTVEQASAGNSVTAAAPARRGLAKSATLITLGNLVGSVLGMIRLLFLNILFYGGASGAFTVSLRPVQQVNDLIIGGSVSGALIPTFVDYGQEDRRAELRKVYNTVATLVTILMVLACVGLIIAAPYFVPLETQRFTPADQQLTVRLVQIGAISLLGLGLYAVGSALLYALKQVVFPAFAASLYHLAIIICGSVVLLWALWQAGLPFDAAFQPGADNSLVEATRAQGAHGLAFGAAVGAAAEFLLLLIPLRRILKVWRPALHLRHPGVRQILRLYAPLTGGLVMAFVVSNLELTLIGLTSGGAPQNATSLASATTLIQFPVGLVSSALSFSILPLLVPAVNSGDIAGFKATLRLGIRLALLLMVPAAVGLIVLREPIAVLLFQHGACAHACTYRNVLALQNLAYQLPFVALYQLLVAAFFARKNTVIPVLVGIPGILSYAAIGTPLTLGLGLPGVAFANGIGPTVQAVALFALLSLQIGDLGLGALASGAARILAAAAGMAGACWGTLQLLPLLDASIFSLDTFLGALLTVCVAGGVGIGLYFVFAVLFQVEEVRLLADFARARLRH